MADIDFTSTGKSLIPGSIAVHRCGAGRKRETARQPGLVAALEGLIEDAIRGDPEAPPRWVSRSQRNITEALRRHGFQVSRKLVGRLLREQQYSLSG